VRKPCKHEFAGNVIMGPIDLGHVASPPLRHTAFVSTGMEP
jgi:hypothetical protein